MPLCGPRVGALCFGAPLLAAACAPAATSARLTPDAPAPPAAPAIGSRADAFLDTVQARTFRWFWELTPAKKGLTPDRTPIPPFSSIAAVGFALTAYAVGVERGYITRDQASERVLTTLKFFWSAPQGADSAGFTGYKGFFYHFLDMETGLRFGNTELSTIDTTLLLGGVLFCQSYFDDPTDAAEAAIRAYADSIYLRVDWRWAKTKPLLVSMGWHPERGFIDAYWDGYDEAMLLVILAIASPTFSLGPEAWKVYTRPYEWREFYGQSHVNFAPLFGHQYSHVWIDFRGIQDAYMRERGIDYFENSRRATLSQRAYAIDNPMRWRDYGADIWGLTASDGPFDTTLIIDGRRRQFFSYRARGAAATEIVDDGTIVPTAAGGSVPFAPEITITALKAIRKRYGDALFRKYGFVDAFNPTLRDTALTPKFGRIVPGRGWFDTDYLGIDQGPILLMIENYRTGLIWKVMKKNGHIVRGLCRAGFIGGWLKGRCGLGGTAGVRRSALGAREQDASGGSNGVRRARVAHEEGGRH